MEGGGERASMRGRVAAIDSRRTVTSSLCTLPLTSYHPPPSSHPPYAAPSPSRPHSSSTPLSSLTTTKGLILDASSQMYSWPKPSVLHAITDGFGFTTIYVTGCAKNRLWRDNITYGSFWKPFVKYYRWFLIITECDISKYHKRFSTNNRLWYFTDGFHNEPSMIRHHNTDGSIVEPSVIWDQITDGFICGTICDKYHWRFHNRTGCDKSLY